MPPNSRISPAALGRRLERARAIASDAAALLLAARRGIGAAVTHKGAVDLVTEADRESERLVVTALAAACPEDRIVGEEGAAVGPADAPYTWYVDPLDGTTNYVAGLPHFAVSLGLAAGELPVLGVVDAPALGAVYFGAAGLGAFITEHGAAPTPLRVHPATSLQETLAATGFPYDRAGRVDALLAPVGRALGRCLGVRRLGSAALDLAQVAAGAFGVYWERGLKPWDLVAGAALVAEAGGRVTDLSGGGRLLGGDIAASNGALHTALLDDIVRGAP